MPGRILRACSNCGWADPKGLNYDQRCSRCGPRQKSPTTLSRPSSSTERQKIRLAVLRRDPTCQLRLPGCTGASEVADHILPAVRGGAYTPENLQGACAHCNGSKGSKTSALKDGQADLGVRAQARTPPVATPTHRRLH